jgi:hypothetical protein
MSNWSMCAYIIYFAYISKQSQYLNNKKIYKHIERMLIKKNSDDFFCSRLTPKNSLCINGLKIIIYKSFLFCVSVYKHIYIHK